MKNSHRNEGLSVRIPYVRDLESITFCILSELLDEKCPMARKICGTNESETDWAARIQSAIWEVHSVLSASFYNLQDENSWDDGTSVLRGISFLPSLENHENWKCLIPCKDERRMARFRDFVSKNLRFLEICMTAAEDFPDLQEMGEGWKNTTGRVEGILSRQPDKNA